MGIKQTRHYGQGGDKYWLNLLLGHSFLYRDGRKGTAIFLSTIRCVRGRGVSLFGLENVYCRYGMGLAMGRLEELDATALFSIKARSYGHSMGKT